MLYDQFLGLLSLFHAAYEHLPPALVEGLHTVMIRPSRALFTALLVALGA